MENGVPDSAKREEDKEKGRRKRVSKTTRSHESRVARGKKEIGGEKLTLQQPYRQIRRKKGRAKGKEEGWLEKTRLDSSDEKREGEKERKTYPECSGGTDIRRET